jgi:hypothetical protein
MCKRSKTLADMFAGVLAMIAQACIKICSLMYTFIFSCNFAVDLHSQSFGRWQDHQEVGTSKLVNIGQLLQMCPCAPGRQKEQTKEMICQ